MIVCLCHAVSERTIRRAVTEGAGTIGAIARATRAGTCCGSCVCDAKRILRQQREREADEGDDADLLLAAK